MFTHLVRLTHDGVSRIYPCETHFDALVLTDLLDRARSANDRIETLPADDYNRELHAERDALRTDLQTRLAGERAGFALAVAKERGWIFAAPKGTP